jgi:ATP-dependent Zn protease
MLDLQTPFGELMDGNTENVKLDLVTSRMNNLIMTPLATAASSLTKGLVNGIFTGNGITLPDTSTNAQEVNTGLINSTIDEEFQLAITGPITVILPKGLSFVDMTSTAGNLDISEIDGRQKIVYTVPPGEFEDTISFRFNISWLYIFMQFWVYPMVLLLVLFLVGRKIRKRRKRKKGAKKAKKARDSAEMKGQIGDDEFADLAGFHSPAIHGDQEIFQTYDSTIEVDAGPLSYVDDEGRFS